MVYASNAAKEQAEKAAAQHVKEQIRPQKLEKKSKPVVEVFYPQFGWKTQNDLKKQHVDKSDPTNPTTNRIKEVVVGSLGSVRHKSLRQILLQLKAKLKCEEIQCLIDSGATGEFLEAKVAARNAEKSYTDQGMSLELADGG